MTAALEGAGQVGTRLRTSMSVRRALIEVLARPLVRAEAISVRARAGEAAERVAAEMRAGAAAVVGGLALVDVRTASARRVHLVAGVTEAPVRTHRVDAAAVGTGVRHHPALVQICRSTASASSSSSSSTNFIATQVLQKLQGRCVSRVSQVSMVLLSVVCVAV